MPIIHRDIEQGTSAWMDLRRGIPTASEFKKIVTGTGKLSEQSKGYACQLIAETLLGYTPNSLDGIPDIERGRLLEPDAVRMYEYEFEAETKKVAFVTTDDKQVGCSPDRFVGDDGLLEIKCPNESNMIWYSLFGLGREYIGQIQGQLWVTERKWCDFYAYSPNMPPVRIRVQRDEVYINTLKAAVTQFVQEKNELLEKIKREGFYEKMEDFRASKDPHEYSAILAG